MPLHEHRNGMVQLVLLVEKIGRKHAGLGMEECLGTLQRSEYHIESDEILVATRHALPAAQLLRPLQRKKHAHWRS